MWSVTLRAHAASTDPVSISATSTNCQDAITMDNVLFGDVYICSGQSNMDYTLNNVSAISKFNLELFGGLGQ